MNATLTEEFQVRYREVDRYGRLKLSSVFDFMQQAAADHAERLGVGYSAIVPLNRIWVLSRLKLQLARSPGAGETVRVLTYPTQFKRIFAHRQFLLTGEDGGELGCATSLWLYLDRENLRPRRISELPAPLPDNADLPEYFPLADRPAQLAASGPALLELPVRFSMEDVNAHLNNAEYAGAVNDALAALLPPECRVAELDLEWHAAARAGDVLRLYGQAVPGGEFAVSGYLQDRLSFTATGRTVTAG